VAALSSRETGALTPSDRFRLLRELGARPVPTWAALESLPNGRTQLVVVESVARGGEYGDQEIADWVRDARRIAALEHPNVARVRDVLIRGDDVMVAAEYLDGVRWAELAARPIPLELTLRVILDVLAGLSALHNLRDAKRQPLKLVHGELTPDCVIVGEDGVARIVGSCRAKSAAIPPGRAGAGYLAPEVLLADDSADARADLFSVGVLLWEALCGASLFGEKTQASAIVTRVLGGKLPPAVVPAQYPWAAPLVDLVARALSADPQKRFASAPEMAAELRRIAGPKLAAPSRLAAHVRTGFGDRIRARREHLERAEARPPEVSRIEPQSEPRHGAAWRDSLPPDAPTPVPPKPYVAVAAPPVPPAPPAPQVPAASLPRPAQRSLPQPARQLPQKPSRVLEPGPVAAAPPVAPPASPVVKAPSPAEKLPDLLAQPPPLPALRARLPTLNGVAPEAPPAPDDVKRPPVVVPSSNPPPPPAAVSPSESELVARALRVPAAPRVPSDLAAAALALSPPAAAPAPSGNARALASTQTSRESSSPRRRAILWGAAAGIAASALIIGWAALRPGRSSSSQRTASSARAVDSSESAPLRPPPAPLPAVASPSDAVSNAVPAPSVPPPSKPLPAAPAEVVAAPNPAQARAAAPNPLPATAPIRSNASQAPARKSKPRYDPQGI
jgi:serine/threonine protein kinase